MLIKDVMTRNVEEIGSLATLQDAAEKMKSCDVGALPVCENDKLVGILTDRDIAVRAVANGQDPTQTPVYEVMSPTAIYCYEDEDIRDAAELMEQKQIRRLVVFNRNQRVVGIVSLGDIATRLGNDRISADVLEQVSQPSQPHM
jgi:CBS domain-containing protein